MFHHFHRHGEPSAQGSITAESFATILDKLSDHHNLLTAEKWMQRALSASLAADEICLTFDDALQCQYEIAAPIMQARGLTGFFFVYSSVFEGQLENLELYRRLRTDHFETIDAFYQAFEEIFTARFPELAAAPKLLAFKPADYLKPFEFYSDSDRRFRFIRDEILGVNRYVDVMDTLIKQKGLTKSQLAKNLWMTNAQLQNLSAAGHIIGLHSYSHPTRLCALSHSEQQAEYQKNFDHLSRVLGKHPTTMSHPCNAYDSGTLDILQGLGIKLGFCSNMVALDTRSMLEFPRRDHADVMKAIAA